MYGGFVWLRSRLKALSDCFGAGQSIESVEQQFKFTEPQICTNPSCGNRKKWRLVMEKSVFVDFQKVRWARALLPSRTAIRCHPQGLPIERGAR